MAPQIEIAKDRLADFCRRHRIEQLALFGSVLRDDFRPESDIDVLVAFSPDARIGLIRLAELELELSALLGRRAEIHTPGGLNPHFRDRVIQSAEVQYERT